MISGGMATSAPSKFKMLITFILSACGIIFTFAGSPLVLLIFSLSPFRVSDDMARSVLLQTRVSFRDGKWSDLNG